VTRNFGVRPHLWKGRWDDIAMPFGELKEPECHIEWSTYVTETLILFDVKHTLSGHSRSRR
jgi:hypothetical protein